MIEHIPRVYPYSLQINMCMPYTACIGTSEFNSGLETHTVTKYEDPGAGCRRENVDAVERRDERENAADSGGIATSE